MNSTAFDRCVITLANPTQGEAGLMVALKDVWAAILEATADEMPAEMGTSAVEFGPFTESRALCSMLSIFSGVPVGAVEVLMKASITLHVKGGQL